MANTGHSANCGAAHSVDRLKCRFPGRACRGGAQEPQPRRRRPFTRAAVAPERRKFAAHEAHAPSATAFSSTRTQTPMNKVLRLSDLIAEGKLSGKRVFIRADLNVPQDDQGNITEDTRIRASVPAIKASLDAGAAVMVTSHLGRPTEGDFKPQDSLAPVAKRLSELLGQPVELKQNWVDGVDVAPGQVVLLENCRVNKGEK